MSNFYNLMSGVKDAIVDLGLTEISTNVHIRKRISYFKGHDSLPMIQVVPGGSQRIAGLQFPDGVWYDYPILVATIVETGYTPEDLSTQLDNFETIGNRLYYIGATGVSGVIDVSYNPSPAFDIPLLPDGFDVSLQLFTYRIAQSRRIS